jgi:predicted nucleic acid-binding protein
VIAQVSAYLRWKKKEKVVPFFIHLVRGLTSLRKVETEFTDFVDAMDIQERAKLSWKAWDDLVITAQMKRLGLTQIYSRDTDFDAIPEIKRIF